MLSLMRKHSRSPVIKILLLSVVVSFIIGFGALGYVRRSLKKDSGRGNMDAVATVNGVKIPPAEFTRELHNRERYYQRMLGEHYEQLAASLNIKQQVLDQLIQRALLLGEAQKLGLKVSDEEVRRKILTYESFLKDGKFDSQQYEDILRSNHSTPEQFEDQERSNLQIMKISDFIISSARVSDAELWNGYVMNADKVNLRYVAVGSDKYIDQVKVSDEEAAAYYAAHKDRFKLPEERSAQYLEFDAQTYADKAAVTDDEIQKHYNENLATQFTEKEQVRARHVLIKVAQDASPEVREAAKIMAEAVLKKAKAGEDFAELAKRYSQDETTKDKGGDLGLFPKGRMQKTFEDAAFALNPGEVSDVISTSFGLHVIKVEERKAAREVSLEEAKPIIAKMLKEQKEDQAASQEAERVRAGITAGATLADAAKKEGLEIKTTQPLAQSDQSLMDKLGPIFMKTLFNLQKDEISKPVQGRGVYTIVQLKDVVAPRIPEFAEVKAEAVDAAKKDAAAALASKRAEAILDKMKSGKSMEEVAKQEGLEVKTTGLFSRRGPQIPQIGSSKELKEAAFRLTDQSPFPAKPVDVAGQLVVFQFTDRKTPSKEEFETAKEDLRNTLIQEKGEEAFRVWLEAAKAKAKIEYNSALLERL